MVTAFTERINYDGKLETISKKVCEAYALGSFIANEIVPIGYEDCNVILNTSTGKYFMKIFSKTRDVRSCQRYIAIMTAASAAGISTPAIHISPQGALYTLALDQTTLYLCVLTYVAGKDLYTLQEDLSAEQITYLGHQVAKINTLTLQPEFVYDSWAISNFKTEFEKKSIYLSPEDLLLLQPLVQAFNNLDSETLPTCFVHGDIIKTNVIKDANNQLSIIDFSVANTYPRIQEIAVLACNVLFDEQSKQQSEQNIHTFLAAYQEHIKLTTRELEVLPIYIQLAHAMHLLCANYEQQAEHNTTAENTYWLQLGRKGLQQ